MSKISLREQQTGPEVHPVKGSSAKELSRGAEDGAQELSQQQDDVTCSTGDKALGPGMEEGPQPCVPAGPGSPSPAGTAAAAEAAPAPPCASPGPGRATEAEPAAAAPAGAAGQEEPREPLAAQQEQKAPQPPVPSWELPSARAQSRVPAPGSPPAGRNLVLELAWPLSREYEWPILRSKWELEGVWDMEQRLAVKMGETATAEREQSPVPDPLRPPRPLPAQLGAIREQQEGTAAWSEEGSDEEISDCDRAWDSCSDTDLSQGEYDTDTELSPEEEDGDEDLSQFGVTFSPEDRGSSPEMEGDVVPKPYFTPESDTCSRWVPVIYDPLKTPLSPEVSLGQDVTPGNGHRPSVHSSWENDSDQELAQEPWEVGTESGSCVKPLAPEEDEWDELSVLELPLEEDKEQKQRAFAADGLPVPVPREAWAEGPAPEPCSLPSPSPARLGAQALHEEDDDKDDDEDDKDHDEDEDDEEDEDKEDNKEDEEDGDKEDEDDDKDDQDKEEEEEE
ncbi:otolith matrix protein OMM-64-like [Corvus moneduloides]|uniref:otolith matrix protein OMM-64-like n=1 Tax=Corvus moneduloides TaxID=1196302 RepID=UPI001362A348|nr:otolith matrix protein OMM-64-like [Corvus moneduloides]